MNREESFEEWFKEVFPNAYRNNPYEARAKAAWNHQAKKIEALEKENLNLNAKIRVLELRGLNSDLKTIDEYNNLVAALKKMRKAAGCHCTPYYSPCAACGFNNSPEYQAIKHLLEDECEAF